MTHVNTIEVTRTILIITLPEGALGAVGMHFAAWLPHVLGLLVELEGVVDVIVFFEISELYWWSQGSARTLAAKAKRSTADSQPKGSKSVGI